MLGEGGTQDRMQRQGEDMDGGVLHSRKGNESLRHCFIFMASTRRGFLRRRRDSTLH